MFQAVKFQMDWFCRDQSKTYFILFFLPIYVLLYLLSLSKYFAVWTLIMAWPFDFPACVKAILFLQYGLYVSQAL